MEIDWSSRMQISFQFRSRTISTKTIILLLLLFVLSAYFLGLSSLLARIFNLPVNTVGSQALATLIPAVVLAAITVLWRLVKHGPISVPLPSLKILRKRLSQSELEENFSCNNCLLMSNEFLAAGDNRFEKATIKYRQMHPQLSAAATFKARSQKKRYEYWRYGIAIHDHNKVVALFHLDSHDQIVLYLNEKLFLLYQSERFLSNHAYRLKACISNQNGIRAISFFLGDTLIHQNIEEKGQENYTVSFEVWSDQYRDHYVKIKDVWITSQALR